MSFDPSDPPVVISEPCIFVDVGDANEEVEVITQTSFVVLPPTETVSVNLGINNNFFDMDVLPEAGDPESIIQTDFKTLPPTQSPPIYFFDVEFFDIDAPIDYDTGIPDTFTHKAEEKYNPVEVAENPPDFTSTR